MLGNGNKDVAEKNFRQRSMEEAPDGSENSARAEDDIILHYNFATSYGYTDGWNHIFIT